ncbi:hypothetical protein [Methanosarcina spelaei]|nr:hypothetical protein [Methanosarcina spelaei]
MKFQQSKNELNRLDNKVENRSKIDRKKIEKRLKKAEVQAE